jgi:hypothetical protein
MNNLFGSKVLIGELFPRIAVKDIYFTYVLAVFRSIVKIYERLFIDLAARVRDKTNVASSINSSTSILYKCLLELFILLLPFEIYTGFLNVRLLVGFPLRNFSAILLHG